MSDLPENFNLNCDTGFQPVPLSLDPWGTHLARTVPQSRAGGPGRYEITAEIGGVAESLQTVGELAEFAVASGVLLIVALAVIATVGAKAIAYWNALKIKM
jgi:hypothetical protein